MTVPAEPRDPAAPARESFPIVEWLLVLLSFAIFATLRSPVPGVNEPHYLTKAKHFWDSSWCSRDPFLQSTNAHYVFYAVFGWLTRFCTLEQTAWIGRILGWMLLSSGWTILAHRLLKLPWSALWSAWLFLLMAAIGNWSGEWVVGGIEAKVISYGCAWWSLAAAISGRPVAAAAWSGAAVSFHPVVGIWHTGAVCLAICVSDPRPWRVLRQINWRELACCGLAWSLCAAPGLIPAIAMLRDANKDQSYAADWIQVFHRLAHHLNPWRFAASGYWGYGGLILISAMLYINLKRLQPASETASNRSPTTSAEGEFSRLNAWNLAARYAAVAVLIACGGILVRAIPNLARWLLATNLIPSAAKSLDEWIRYEPHLAGVLKFYPFRLADVTVPLFASMIITLAICQIISRSIRFRAIAWQWSLFAGCLAISLCLPAVDSNPSRMSADQFADWVDACHWVERETPRDALCYATNEGWALKWFAQRADYLSNKDCPQDAAGIIAWNERLIQIGRWSDKYLQNGFSPAAMKELRRLTKVDYLIARKFGPIELQPVYQNRSYKVYRLAD